MTPVDSPEHVVEMLDHAFNNGDLEAVLAFYEEAAALVAGPTTILRGRAQLSAFFESVLQSGSHAKQLKVRVIESGEIALFLSRWTLIPKGSTATRSGQEFFATTVMRKQPDGSWKVLIDNPIGPAALESS